MEMLKSNVNISGVKPAERVDGCWHFGALRGQRSAHQQWWKGTKYIYSSTVPKHSFEVLVPEILYFVLHYIYLTVTFQMKLWHIGYYNKLLKYNTLLKIKLPDSIFRLVTEQKHHIYQVSLHFAKSPHSILLVKFSLLMFSVSGSW